jgi:glycosyltransferase involved in cell wall biosynthesis
LRDKFIALYAGTIGMAHGLESILEAARLLRDKRDIHFVIAGDGARRSALENAAEGLDNVSLIGQRRRDEIAAMWKEADVGLVLLRSIELFKTVIPSKMFEVMASGTPLVLGVEGQAKEILDSADAGAAIEPQNAQALAAAVLRYHDDPELRRKHGANGAGYVRRHYDLDLLAGRYMNVLEEAAT